MSKFIFQQAVAKAKRDYPDETRNITFIDGSDPNARAQVAEWISENMSPQFLTWLSPDKTMAEMLEHNTQRTIDNGFCAVRDPVSRKSMLYFNSDAVLEDVPLERNTKLHYIFNHELGHLLVKGGMSSDLYLEHKDKTHAEIKPLADIMTLLSENKADSFGALQTLVDRHMTTDDIRTIAFERARVMLTRDIVSHLTSMSLDGLSLKADAGHFISLEPAEIKAIAAAHATESCPTPDDMVGIKAISQQIAEKIAAQQDPTPLMAEWVMEQMMQKPSIDTPVNIQSRYIAARFATHMLSSPDNATALEHMEKSHGKTAEADLRSALKDIAPAGSPQAKLFTPAPKRPS